MAESTLQIFAGPRVRARLRERGQRRDRLPTLPGGKLPDRGDFEAFGDDEAGRQRAWRRALAESQRLAEEFDRLARRDSVAALPLP